MDRRLRSPRSPQWGGTVVLSSGNHRGLRKSKFVDVIRGTDLNAVAILLVGSVRQIITIRGQILLTHQESFTTGETFYGAYFVSQASDFIFEFDVVLNIPSFLELTERNSRYSTTGLGR